MKCPNCGYSESKVIDSRPSENSTIRRRRECLSCSKRFTTYETIQTEPIIVIKKGKTTELFDKNKIISGLMKSCYKRPVSKDDIINIANEIENELSNSMSNEVTTDDIGIMVMERLRRIDEVSYVRFASVYREFKDVETFLSEINSLLKGDKTNE